VKVEFVGPFIKAAIQALDSAAGVKSEHGQLAVRSATFTTQQVSIVIGVDGAVEGQVVYGFSLVTATKIAAALSNKPAMAFDESTSNAITEMGNAIGKCAASLLAEAGYECQIVPPKLIRGSDIQISTATPALVVPLYTDFGKIEINVALQEISGAGKAVIPQNESLEIAASAG
jgi:chemotaxis protein CheX